MRQYIFYPDNTDDGIIILQLLGMAAFRVTAQSFQLHLLYGKFSKWLSEYGKWDVFIRHAKRYCRDTLLSDAV